MTLLDIMIKNLLKEQDKMFDKVAKIVEKELHSKKENKDE